MTEATDDKRTPYMRLWINDARSSCHIMSAAQFGAHMRMLMHGWERGYVPADERLLRRIVGDIDWVEMPEVLDRWQKVTLEDGNEVLINPRQERERERMIKEGNRRRESGRRGAERRWGSKIDGNEDGNDDGNEDGENMAFPNSQSPKVPNAQTSQFSDPSLLRSEPCDARSKRKRKKPDDPLQWHKDTGWVGITDADHAEWRDLFPAVDSGYELKRLDRWLRDHPTKANKSNWRRWLNKLFAVKQDEGGTRSRRTSLTRDESHIPEDVHPDDRRLFFTPDGKPRTPAVWHRKDGSWSH